MKRLEEIVLGFVIFWILLWFIYASVEPSHASSVNTTIIYNTSGVEQTGEHIVMGTVTLAAGTATVTFTGKAVFSSSSSFVCAATDATGLNVGQIVRNSGSSITVNGVLTDTVQFVCMGN
jgi:hypothetical protein